MKVFFLAVCSLLSVSSIAQSITWSPPVSVGTSGYSNLRPRIVTDRNGNPLVLWGNATTDKAYFSRWNGTGFTTPTALNPAGTPIFAADWAGPEIGGSGDTVYVVFKKIPETDTANKMYITRSFDGGQNFSAPVRIDDIGDSLSRFPTVTADDAGNPVVAYMKFDPGFLNPRYVVTSSSDHGNSFMPDVKASGTSDVCDCCPATVLSSGNNRLVLYRNNASNIRTIWASVSTNSGGSFSNNILVDSTNLMLMACPSSGPDGIIVGDTVYNVFMSIAGSYSRVFKSKASISTGTAGSTTPMTGPITGLTVQNFPRIAHAGLAAAVVWKQTVTAVTQIAISFTPAVTAGFPSVPETVATGMVINADVAMTPGAVHVVWQDNASGTVMYRKGTYATTGIGQVAQTGTPVTLYPNPARGYFSFSAMDIGEVASCTIIDIAGKRLETSVQRNGSSYDVSLPGLSNGVYHVLIADQQGRTFHSPLVIEK